MIRYYAYTRVSTQEQADSGLGLDAQAHALSLAAQQRGVELEWAEDAGYSSMVAPDKRPALSTILTRLELGDGDGLMVMRLDRLSRSVHDFAFLLAKSKAEGWALVILDLGVDTSTPVGKFIVQVMASVAELERDMISLRTREALAAKRTRGWRDGRPRFHSPELRARIVSFREEGRTLRGIADLLNEEGVPTEKPGGRWYASSVRAILRSVERDRCLDEAGLQGQAV